ncbi:MAG: 4Fe-4S binding protein [Lachnospiraceae bacterium]|nr:4Fe-4S binding protein [Lachnospiraceae bacterium]
MKNSDIHAKAAPDKKIRGLKRKLIQIAAFGFTNSRVPNFLSGRLYTGKWKEFCVPGLNCYSCPAATFACPIGALQAVTGTKKSPVSFYVLGLLLAFGVVFGRGICGFLCPFGLLQELLAKVPFPKKNLPAFMRYVKYLILVVFVLILPLVLTVGPASVPAFCKYICPAGTLEGGIPAVLTQPSVRSMLGPLFCWKLGILIAVIVLCTFVHRFFCKVLCPLGAIYGLLNRVSILRLTVDHDKCIHCRACESTCKMDVYPVMHPDSAECIRCGECAQICPKGAISVGMGPVHFAGSPTKNM